MTDTAEDRTESRRRWWTFGVLVVSVTIAISLGIGWHLLSAGSPSKENPSFRYGEDVMLTQLYGSGSGGADAVCRTAMEHPVNPPADFDRAQAIAGCKYQESLLDN